MLIQPVVAQLSLDRVAAGLVSVVGLLVSIGPLFISSWKWIVAEGWYDFQALGYFLYNRLLHPLHHIRGPLLATLTPWVQLYHGLKGDRHVWLYSLHQRYGSHVRVAPNFISVNTAEGLHDIYGHGKRAKKADFYNAFPAIKGVYNTHNAIDKTMHGRKRRVLSQAFSDHALKGMEDLMLLHIRQFLAIMGGDILGDEVAASNIEKGLVVRNLADWFGYLTYDVMGELCFGKSFGMLLESEKRGVIGLVGRAAYRHYVVCVWFGWPPF